MILNRVKDYYKNNKERLWVQARDKYGTYLKKKIKKENTGKIDMSGEKKQRLKEYQKNYQRSYRGTKKSQYNK